MSIELVRKPVSGTYGGEITSDAGVVKVAATGALTIGAASAATGSGVTHQVNGALTITYQNGGTVLSLTNNDAGSGDAHMIDVRAQPSASVTGGTVMRIRNGGGTATIYSIEYNGNTSIGNLAAAQTHNIQGTGTTLNVKGNSAGCTVAITSGGGGGSVITQQDGSGNVNRIGHVSTVGRLQMQCSTAGVELTAGATSWAAISDIRRKNAVADLDYGLAQVAALRPVTFHYIDDPEGTTRRIGMIAQEVKEVMPEFVLGEGTGENGDYYSLDLTNMIPVLVKAIKELKERVETLEAAKA